MMTRAWISLGSNLGDRREILDQTLVTLNRTCGIVVSAVSTYHETRPVGGPAGQGLFLNAAAGLETSLSPRELLAATQAIERDSGRVRTNRWGERTLDLDVLIFGSSLIDEPDLKLPHPRLPIRRFVLEPLAEFAADVIEPITQRPIGDLLANLNRLPRSVMFDDRLVDSFPRMHEKLAATLRGRPIALSDPESDGRDRRIQSIISSVDGLGLRKIHRLQSIARDRSLDPNRWTVFNFSIDLARPGSFSSLASTLIVDLNDSHTRRKSGIASTPTYRPEATDEAGIISELSAICRGIEGV